MGEFRRTDRPPAAGPAHRIERLKKNEQVQVCILCDKPEWFLTHWQPAKGNRKGFSMPHVDPHEECKGCQAHLPQKWRGFLECLDFHKKVRCFQEITPGMLEDLERLLPDAVSYRGLVIIMKRLNGDQARLKCQLEPHWESRSNEPLLPAIGVEKVLRKLWEYNAVE